MDWDDEELVDDVAGSLEEYEQQQTWEVTRPPEQMPHNAAADCITLTALIVLAILLVVVIAVVAS